MKRLWRYRYALGFAGVLCVAVFLRFYLLRSIPPGLYPDEAFDGNEAVRAMAIGRFDVFYPGNGGREGLFMLLLALSLKVFATHAAWVLRVPSGVIGVLTVAVLCFLMRELATVYGKPRVQRIGLFAGLFLATSTWHIVLSRDAFRAILVPFIASLSLLFVLRALRRQSLGEAFLAGILLALGMYTYPSFRVVPLMLLPLYGQWKPVPGRWRLLAGFMIPAFLGVLPLGVYAVMHYGAFFSRLQGVSAFRYGNSAGWREVGRNIFLMVRMLFWKGDSNWRHGLPGMPQFGWLGAVLVGASLLRLAKLSNDLERVLVVWLAIAAIPALLSADQMPHALRSILMLVPLCGLAALTADAGLAWLERRAGLRLAGCVTALLVVSVGAGAYRDYFHTWAGNSQVAVAYERPFQEVADRINALPAAVPKYVVPYDTDPHLCFPEICRQTVQFLTDTYLPERAAQKGVTYLTRDAYEYRKNGIVGEIFLLH